MSQCVCFEGMEPSGAINNPRCICPEGFSKRASGAGCDACALGKFSKSFDSTICLGCPTGSTTLQTGSTNASQCVCSAQSGRVMMADGRCQCPPGSQVNDESGGCKPCSANLYSSGYDATSCLSCPERAVSLSGSASASDCSCTPESSMVQHGGSGPCNCPPDTYLKGLLCLPCPAGMECSDPQKAPSECSTGEFSLEGDASCNSCRDGLDCSESDQLPQECPSGSFCTLGRSLKCPAGKTSMQNQSKCLTCSSVLSTVSGGQSILRR